ncbi:Protein dmp2 [Castilleja foliolosa]|uniref:Protein dmp2 n=1 Tax=Castilleja foliolosa TaxID=1961234 RepID=A0ABD3CZV8_9LAMI
MSSKSSNPPPPPRTLTRSTLTGIGNLIKLLPTGTVFLFQFLNPLLTNNGKCHTVNKYLSSILITLCSFSCCFASFTDSYTDSQGNVHYGIATRKGLWPNSSPDDSSTKDLSKYKLRFGDFVHGFFALVVFGVVSLLDPNSVECFYPSFESTQKVLLMVLPPAIGTIASSIFVMFPNNRHGIGYPFSQDSTPSSNSA